MLTQEDIKLIIEAQKTVFPTRDEFEEHRTEVRDLKTAVDRLASLLQKYIEEQQVLKHRLERLESWVKQAADKLGLSYKA